MIIFMDLIFAWFANAHLHALTVETGRFSKTADDKVDLSFQTLTLEVKPCRCPIGVDLLVHSDQVSVLSFHLFDLSKTSTLKVTLEQSVSNFYHFAVIRIHASFLEFACFGVSLQFLDGLEGLNNIQGEFLLYFPFGSVGLCCGVPVDVCREGIGEKLVMMALKLISALLSVHYFILILFKLLPIINFFTTFSLYNPNILNQSHNRIEVIYLLISFSVIFFLRFLLFFCR